MASKEATARIKINRLLEEAGWRFFDEAAGPANIVLEPNIKLKGADIDALGEDFERTKNGFVDFLLLDANGKPLCSPNPISPRRNRVRRRCCRPAVPSTRDWHCCIAAES
jgi:type I restriction enzyme, R subunit